MSTSPKKKFSHNVPANGECWDFFISYVQAESDAECLKLFYELGGKGKVWRDLEMDAGDKGEDAMKEGVQHSNVLLLLLSQSYHTRPFCIKEALWAKQERKPILTVHTAAAKTLLSTIFAELHQKGLEGIGGNEATKLVLKDPDFTKVTINKIEKNAAKLLEFAQENAEKLRKEAFEVQYAGRPSPLPILLLAGSNRRRENGEVLPALAGWRGHRNELPGEVEVGKWVKCSKALFRAPPAILHLECCAEKDGLVFDDDEGVVEFERLDMGLESCSLQDKQVRLLTLACEGEHNLPLLQLLSKHVDCFVVSGCYDVTRVREALIKFYENLREGKSVQVSLLETRSSLGMSVLRLVPKLGAQLSEAESLSSALLFKPCPTVIIAMLKLFQHEVLELFQQMGKEALSQASTGPRSVGGDSSEDEEDFTLGRESIRLYSLMGSTAHSEEDLKDFLKYFVHGDQQGWTNCMLLLVDWVHSFSKRHAELADGSLQQQWFEIVKRADLRKDNCEENLLDEFEKLIRSTKPTLKICGDQTVECHKRHVKCIEAIHVVLCERTKRLPFGAIEAGDTLKRMSEYALEELQRWYTDATEGSEQVLHQVNKLLSEEVSDLSEEVSDNSSLGICVLKAAVETGSYVAFVAMSSLAASVLFAYLQVVRLRHHVERTGTTEGLEAGGKLDSDDSSTSLPGGFQLFASSAGRVFSLEHGDCPKLDARSVSVVMRCLQCLTMLSQEDLDNFVATYMAPDTAVPAEKVVTVRFVVSVVDLDGRSVLQAEID